VDGGFRLSRGAVVGNRHRAALERLLQSGAVGERRAEELAPRSWRG
jgi:hypothetical protein